MSQQSERTVTKAVVSLIDRLAAENAVLRAALEPFVKISLWRDRYPDAKRDELTAQQLKGYIRAADVRAAREALGPYR